ncbi:U2 snRNP-associated protein Uap2 [Corynespora cassiicola Philippines]|uniref:U2 snRNP-associated protein Uap2 n=1 Tax=Corynespora cassiicola Philippines TaxID=1448308 RepID=A0A2T2P6U1_CORCC|nr:U2 snRNP-associated protein Uap2 [Corynespora cassiicola Philippines]
MVGRSPARSPGADRGLENGSPDPQRESPDAQQQKKRKKGPAAGEGNSKKPRVQENRAIYITNLPHDTTVKEIEDVFKKYGMIDQGVDGAPRIKLYRDDDGNFNGTALVVYFKKDSVDIAIRLMDDYEFRMGDRSNGTIRVQEADMSYKKTKDNDEAAAKMVRKDRKTAERNRAEMNRKLAEWSDNEDQAAETYAPKKSKWEKIAIVKHAFTLAELEDNPEEIFDIVDDMTAEGNEHGEVTNVTVYDKEPEGIVAVRFKDAKSAEEFKKKNHGRWFDKRALDVSIAVERPRFKKSGKGGESDEEEEADRLERFMTATTD